MALFGDRKRVAPLAGQPLWVRATTTTTPASAQSRRKFGRKIAGFFCQVNRFAICSRPLNASGSQWAQGVRPATSSAQRNQAVTAPVLALTELDMRKAATAAAPAYRACHAATSA